MSATIGKTATRCPARGVAESWDCDVSVLAGSMSRFQPPRRLGCALAVLAVVVLAPAAQAGCGDYVQIASTAPVASHTTSAPKSKSPTPGCPCHEAHCSQRPVPAPLLPVAPTSPMAEQAINNVVGQLPHEIKATVPFRAPCTLLPSGHPLRLERPPRF